jgi:hypothetical protein
LGDRFDLSGLDVHLVARLVARLDLWPDFRLDAWLDVRFDVQLSARLHLRPEVQLDIGLDIGARLGIVADALESQFARDRAAQAADEDFRRRLDFEQRGAALLLVDAFGDARLYQRVLEHLAFEHGRVVIRDAFQRLVMNNDIRSRFFVAFRRAFRRVGGFWRVGASAAARAAATTTRIFLFRFRLGGGLWLPGFGRGRSFFRLGLLVSITQPALAALARA